MQCPSSLVGKDIELDAGSHQFKSYLTAVYVCILEGPLWCHCDLGCCSQTVVFIKAAAKPRFFLGDEC